LHQTSGVPSCAICGSGVNHKKKDCPFSQRLMLDDEGEPLGRRYKKVMKSIL
jgi:hypothetical protein